MEDRKKSAQTLRQFQKTGFENNKLVRRLFRQVSHAIRDFNMIENGDKVMVCLSGGKDSYSLLDILSTMQRRAPIHFDIVAVHLNKMQPGFPTEIIPRYLEEKGIDFRIVSEDVYNIVKGIIPEGKGGCSLCARLRRGILYRVAGEIGATKIALGHHRDDIIETFFLNLLFAAKLKTMPAKLKTDDARHIVIRPLAYVRESDLVRYAQMRKFPLIPCNFCGPLENMQRAKLKALMQQWEKEFPGRSGSVFAALSSIVPSHLLDGNFFDFKGLSANMSEQSHKFPDTRNSANEGEEDIFGFLSTDPDEDY